MANLFALCLMHCSFSGLRAIKIIKYGTTHAKIFARVVIIMYLCDEIKCYWRNSFCMSYDYR